MGPVILLFGILPKFVFYGTGPTELVQTKIIASLFSPAAFVLGCDILVSLEETQIKGELNSIHTLGYNMYNCLVMMTADIFVYGVLAWYFSVVLAPDSPFHRHLLFFIYPSYWLPGRFLFKGSGDVPFVSIGHESDRFYDPTNYEPLTETQQANVKVRINDIYMAYGDGKVALNGFSLDLVAGEITCLLGQNGMF